MVAGRVTRIAVVDTPVRDRRPTSVMTAAPPGRHAARQVGGRRHRVEVTTRSVVRALTLDDTPRIHIRIRFLRLGIDLASADGALG